MASPIPEASSSSNGAALNLPSVQMQTYVHELSKTLPPPRKQNTACDACRSRKVKCHRVPGQEKCQHCTSKNYDCTHLIQQATSEKKKSTTRRQRTNSSNAPLSTPSVKQPSVNEPTGEPPAPLVPSQKPLAQFQFNSSPQITPNASTRQVLAYLFSPPEPDPFNSSSASYALWGEQADQLQSEQFRSEFALDLVEVFFQIVHTRLPLLHPAQFRDGLGLQPGPSRTNTPNHPALVAVVLAWGAKYSEHPLLIADRRRPSKQSLLARTLVHRTRNIAELLKVHRIPNSDHVVTCLLIEPLQNQNPEEPGGYHGFWLANATRHLLNLQINHKSTMSQIAEPEKRGTLIFAWWMTCICDAYASAYYRRKPSLDDDDYDIDFYTADPVNPEPGDAPLPSPREQLEFLGYYKAAHALARIARQMSRQLWKPSTDSDGVPLKQLLYTSTELDKWREEFLNAVGVPKSYPKQWDFVEAVTSCASDATYHVMWIILFGAVDDFGIREWNDLQRGGSTLEHTRLQESVEAAKRKLMHEGLHGALRIAGLASVLTNNGYLRLDTAVVHVAIIEAGKLLARLGRPEVINCIDGLIQYSHSYEEAGDQAADIRRLFNSVRLAGGDPDLNHMSTNGPRLSTSPPSRASSIGQSSSPTLSSSVDAGMDSEMMVDDSGYRTNLFPSPNGMHSPHTMA